MILARVGDIVVGICPSPNGPVPATGIITSGSPRALESGMPFARIGDIVTFPCGVSVIATGAPRYLEAGLPVARIGDTVTGIASGTITSGSPRFMEI